MISINEKEIHITERHYNHVFKQYKDLLTLEDLKYGELVA